MPSNKRTGGITPQERYRSSRVLSLVEREEISRGVAAGNTIRSIAQGLSRAPSTVSQEVSRHGGCKLYRAAEADQTAWESARRPKRCLLAKNLQLQQIVAVKLKQDWAPQQIAGWLKDEYPANPELWVSHETIYRSLFVQSRGALKKELMSHLRSKRRIRRSRHATAHGVGKGEIVDAVSIRERPAEVEDRAVPGHWEGDLVETALQLDPNSAKGYHWYATALAWRGEYQKALAAIARARALDPDSRAVVADEATIRFDSGQRTEALATVEQLVKLDPQFVSWHSYLAHFYLVMGRDEDYLREAIRAAELQGLSDVAGSLRTAEERLHTGGRQAMLDQLSISETRGDHGAGYAVKVAKYRALAGDRIGTLHWLGVALAQHDHDLVRAVAYVEFEAFRQDRDFQKIVIQAILDASRDAAIENASSFQQGS
jgi:IS30 family transposase